MFSQVHSDAVNPVGKGRDSLVSETGASKVNFIIFRDPKHINSESERNGRFEQGNMVMKCAVHVMGSGNGRPVTVNFHDERIHIYPVVRHGGLNADAVYQVEGLFPEHQFAGNLGKSLPVQQDQAVAFDAAGPLQGGQNQVHSGIEPRSG